LGSRADGFAVLGLGIQFFDRPGAAGNDEGKVLRYRLLSHAGVQCQSAPCQMRLCCVLSAEGLGGVRSKLPPAKANAGDVILATTIAAASMSFVLLNMDASPYRPGKALLP
jgi:hypothetical protein